MFSAVICHRLTGYMFTFIFLGFLISALKYCSSTCVILKNFITHPISLHIPFYHTFFVFFLQQIYVFEGIYGCLVGDAVHNWVKCYCFFFKIIFDYHVFINCISFCSLFFFILIPSSIVQTWFSLFLWHIVGYLSLASGLSISPVNVYFTWFWIHK